MASNENKHKIKKQILEVYSRKHEEVALAQQLMADLFHDKLLPVISEVCDQLSPPDSHHPIDIIEIDLGVLDTSKDKEQLVEQFRLQFYKVLSKAVLEKNKKTAQDLRRSDRLPPNTEFHFSDKAPQSSSSLSQTAGFVEAMYIKRDHHNKRPKFHPRSLELLSYFLKTGLLPWWADNGDASWLDEKLNQLLQLPNEQIQAFLYSTLQRPNERQRFARLLNTDQFSKIISIFVADPKVRKSIAEWESLLPKLARQWVISLMQLEGASRQTFLDYFLNQPKIEPSIPEALEVILQQFKFLGKNKHLSFTELTTFIRQKLPGNAELLNVLEEQGTGQRPPTQKEDVSFEKKLLERLKPEIKTAIQEMEKVVDHMAVILKKESTILWRKFSHTFLLKYLKKEPFSSHQVEALFRLLLHFMGSFSTIKNLTFSEFKSILLDKLPDSALLKKVFQEMEAKEPGLEQQWHTFLSNGKNMEAIEKKGAVDPIASPSLNKKSAFSQSDEMYLQNAGLVVLAPFLPRFFQNLGWLEGSAFKHSQWAHRAVYMLQFLANGSVEAPEFQLPLNKLLCGLDIEALIDLVDPMDEREQQQGEELLTAVIGHAPILRDMAVDSFRRAFLLREGVLKEQSDYWLLRVKRETYDIVLDRFPWSFNIVKLPWMDKAVYVDW